MLLWYCLFHYSITAYTQFPVLLVVPLHHVTFQGHEEVVSDEAKSELRGGWGRTSQLYFYSYSQHQMYR